MASYVYKDKTDYEEDILYHKALYAVLLLLLVLSPLAAAEGEAVRTVSLDEALESAAAKNIDLQSASLTLQQTLRSNDSATDFIHSESIVSIAMAGLYRLAKLAGLPLDRRAFPMP